MEGEKSFKMERLERRGVHVCGCQGFIQPYIDLLSAACSITSKNLN